MIGAAANASSPAIAATSFARGRRGVPAVRTTSGQR
jgi:hypothetical protein